MKIDCHVHLYCGSEASGGYFRPDLVRRVGERIQARRVGVPRVGDEIEQERLYVDTLARHVETSELDRAVLLAFDEIYDQDGVRDPERSRYFVPNDFVESVCRDRPGTFLFGASVHPLRRDALDELERVKAAGAVLIKLLPNSQGFDPADPALGPYYRKARELGLPLLVHGGYEHTIRTLNQSYGDPERWRPALFEGCTVIVAHGGSAGRFHRKETMGAFLKLLEAFPNCFGDTAALTNLWRTPYLKQLLSPERLEEKYGVALEDPFSRFIHGSDFPIPIIALAFGIARSTQALSALPDRRNALQLDIELKRLSGVPDACLTRAHDEIGIGRKVGG
jgi:uncharacterized protein